MRRACVALPQATFQSYVRGSKQSNAVVARADAGVAPRDTVPLSTCTMMAMGCLRCSAVHVSNYTGEGRTNM